MARLPTPGGDNGNWGGILNDYLSQALKSDGTVKDNAITANNIAPNSITSAKIATDAVGATQIADGSIANALLADDTVQEVKLSSAVRAKLNANSGTPDWTTIANKPAVIAAGADQAAARSAIGAGTSNLAIGTTGTSAKAGDYQPVSINISDATALGRALLTAANTAAAKTALSITKSDVGLDDVDNTSDATKNSATATLTNKTLTNPKISQVNDANDNTLLDLVTIPDAVNHIYATNQSSGNYPSLGVDGSDANIGLALVPKGNGPVRIFASTGNSPTLEAVGIDNDIDLNINSKGTGQVKINGSPIAIDSTVIHNSDFTAKGDLLSGIGSGSYSKISAGGDGQILTADSSQTTGLKWAPSPDLSGKVDKSSNPNVLYGTDYLGEQTLWQAETAPSNWTLLQRDGSGNAKADAFIPSVTTTVTAGSTTTLTVDSTEVQIFTGITTQTAVLPTTNIVAGQKYTIISNGSGAVTVTSSNGDTVGTLAGTVGTFIANIATPTNAVHWTVDGMLPVGGFYLDSGFGPWTGAQRNNEGNLKADAFIPGTTSTTQAGGTTTLTVDSNEVQVFTGSGGQTVRLPTTGIVAGQRYTILNPGAGTVAVQSSLGNSLQNVNSTWSATYIALQATPTTASHWTVENIFMGVWTTAPAAWQAVQRDGNANIRADAFIPSLTSTVTAAGTTTLTVDDTEIQVFTGTTTQTVILPTTSIVTGQRYTITNQSTSAVTVNSSAGNLVATLSGGMTATVLANTATPTAATHWTVASFTTTSLNRALTTDGSGMPGQTTVSQNGTQTSSIAFRDSNATLSAVRFAPGYTATATAAATTTLTIASTEIQNFTGTTTQTVVLPTTSVLGGMRWTIINSSTGALTINASGGGLVATVAAGSPLIVTAVTSTPTLSTQWALSSSPTNTAAVVNTLAQRDGQANLSADAFIPGVTSTVTGAGTTTLTVDSTEVQILTGTTTQTIVLPTTSIVAGQRYTVINQSTSAISVQTSDATVIATVTSGHTITATSLQATPTASTHWSLAQSPNLPYRTAATNSSVAVRDNNANLTADAFIASMTSTVTAAGTTTLTVDSTQVQQFTGTTTQTVTLPTTNIVSGQQYTIINNSTGILTINASGGAVTLAIDPNGRSATFTALQATPTLPAHWQVVSTAGYPYRVGASTFSIPYRDANANLSADAFIPSLTSTVTAAGTTTLTVDSTEVQQFTGSLGQTVVLPTTGIVAGQRFLIINNSIGSITIQSSDLTGLETFQTNSGAIVTALQSSPTGPTHWIVHNLSNRPVRAAVQTNSVAQRDGNANILADAFIPSLTSTVTAASTTTLTVDSTEIQLFNGTTTQTVALPTTSIVAGQRYTVVNTSTGIVTVTSSGANLVATVQASSSVIITALQAAPTSAAHWATVSTSSSVATSTGSVSNTLAQRNGSANLTADAFIPSLTSTATAGSTTTLTVDSNEVQVFTGTTTQIASLPTTGITAGHGYKFINQSTGTVTINASGGAIVAIVEAKATIVLHANVAAPTTAAHWSIVGGTAFAAGQVDPNSLWAAGNSETSPRYAHAIQGGVSGAVTFSYFTAPVANTVTKLGWAVNSATSSGTTLCRLGIYTVAANGDMTLVARTANVTTLGNTADAVNSSALDATGGYVTSYTYIPGQRYAHALIQVSSTPAAMATNFPLGIGATQTSPVLSSVRFGQTDLAVSHTAAQVGNNYHQPWIAGLV